MADYAGRWPELSQGKRQDAGWGGTGGFRIGGAGCGLTV
ncbi:hypothetical protein HDF08_001129 [Edaphobacter lichenicola]|uniref:Uncharacterized protein n=1 Tax=Tunturiibacter lichenicola TaxID=2051959 RepID=A0A852VHR3_9BACT|nr:hypothetical protein [Edaphobacter lichenicola]